MKIVDFNDTICKTEEFKYSTGVTGILLKNKDTNERVACATLNIEGVKLGVDEVIIKDYRENIGMYVALREAGVIDKARRPVPVGNNKGFICKLLK